MEADTTGVAHDNGADLEEFQAQCSHTRLGQFRPRQRQPAKRFHQTVRQAGQQ